MLNVSSWSIRNPTPAILLFILLSLMGFMEFFNFSVQDRFAKQYTCEDWEAKEAQQDSYDATKRIALEQRKHKFQVVEYCPVIDDECQENEDGCYP